MNAWLARSSFMRLALLPLALIACENASAPDDPDAVRIRLVNASSVDFARVVVAFPDTTIDYGRVDADRASPYRTVPNAYRYAYVEADVDGGETLLLQPIDYVGEELLEPGDYAYELGIRDDASALTLRLVEE